MNPKQCKRLRKQLGYKPVNTNLPLTEEQQKLKSEYKNLKKNYKTAPQLKQEKFQANAAHRRLEKAEVAKLNAEALKVSRSERLAAKRAAKSAVVVDTTVVAQASLRQAQYANARATMQANEESVRHQKNMESLLVAEANDKRKAEKRADKIKKNLETDSGKTA